MYIYYLAGFNASMALDVTFNARVQVAVSRERTQPD
jgi:hypothetical protein